MLDQLVETLASLRGNFPAASPASGSREERRSPVEDFEDFLADIYGDAGASGMEDLARENREKTKLFRKLLAEMEQGGTQ